MIAATIARSGLVPRPMAVNRSTPKLTIRVVRPDSQKITTIWLCMKTTEKGLANA